MVTFENFKEFYLVKDGMPVTEENLNKAPEQLKKEVDVLNTNMTDLNMSVNNKLIKLNSDIGTISDFLATLN